jgi:Peptidase propeptide and YPEB domain
MRHLLRSALFSALILAPAAAMAFVWPFPFSHPSMPEEAARAIAIDHGFATIDDIDGTIDGDWHIEGKDAYGNELELTIDGSTGAVEHAEMNSH